MAVQFTVQQRVFIYNTYTTTRSYVQTQQRFRQRFPGVRVPVKSSIHSICQKFRQHGTVQNINSGRSGRPRTARTPANIQRVRQAIRNNPRISARKNPVANVPRSSFSRITNRDLRMHPYRIQIRQALQPGDAQRRLTFCRWFVQRPQRMLREICVVDEANFYMNGCVCSTNVRMYAQRGNQARDFVYDTPNDRRKVMVFAAMVGNNNLIGPVFIQGNLNGQSYLGIINQHIVPELQRIFGLQNNGAIRRVWYVQDGATCHRTVAVRNRLQELFPNRVVGMGHAVEWPPRSPDLTPLDFSLWGTLKSEVYAPGPPANLQQLRNRITAAFARIRRTRIVRTSVAAMKTRAQTCIHLGGNQVEGRAAQ